MSTSRPTNSPYSNGANSRASDVFSPIVAPARLEFKPNSMRTFNGAGESNIREWTEKLTAHMFITNVPAADDKRIQILKLFLEGPAYVYFNDIPLADRDTYAKCIALLIAKYNNPNLVWMREQTLQNLKQLGSVQSYTDEYNRLASSLQKPLETRMFAYISGLKTDIRHYVLSQRPETFASAESAAMLFEQLNTEKSDSLAVHAFATDRLSSELSALRQDMLEMKKAFVSANEKSKPESQSRGHNPNFQSQDYRQSQHNQYSQGPQHFYNPRQQFYTHRQPFRHRYPSNRYPNSQNYSYAPRYGTQQHRPNRYRNAANNDGQRDGSNHEISEMANALITAVAQISKGTSSSQDLN